MTELAKGLRARLTERAVARSFKGARAAKVDLPFKPVQSKGPLTGPGSRRGEMDPSTFHRVGKSAFGVDDPRDTVSKADEPETPKKPSAARVVNTIAFAPAHGLVAGKKGKKLKAAGSEFGHGIGGGAVGGVAGGALGHAIGGSGGARLGANIGANVGTVGGLARAAHTNQRKGRYKDEGH